MSKNLKFHYASENDPHDQRRDHYNRSTHASVTCYHRHALVTYFSSLPYESSSQSTSDVTPLHQIRPLKDRLTQFSHFQEQNDSMVSREDGLSLGRQELKRSFVLTRCCRLEFFLQERYPLFHSSHLKKTKTHRGKRARINSQFVQNFQISLANQI